MKLDTENINIALLAEGVQPRGGWLAFGHLPGAIVAILTQLIPNPGGVQCL